MIKSGFDLDDLVLSFKATVGQSRSNLNQIEHVCNIYFSCIPDKDISDLPWERKSYFT